MNISIAISAHSVWSSSIDWCFFSFFIGDEFLKSHGVISSHLRTCSSSAVCCYYCSQAARLLLPLAYPFIVVNVGGSLAGFGTDADTDDVRWKEWFSRRCEIKLNFDWNICYASIYAFVTCRTDEQHSLIYGECNCHFSIAVYSFPYTWHHVSSRYIGYLPPFHSPVLQWGGFDICFGNILFFPCFPRTVPLAVPPTRSPSADIPSFTHWRGIRRLGNKKTNWRWNAKKGYAGGITNNRVTF